MLSLGIVGISMSIAAAPAFAEEVEATFSPGGEAGIKWSGSFTIYKNGGSAKTCTVPSHVGFVEGSYFQLWDPFKPNGALSFSCTGSTTLQWGPEGVAYFNKSYSLTVGDFLTNVVGYHTSPYGPWAGIGTPVPFTNGAGATPSRITFNKTPIGVLQSGGNITATGTINVTTSAGGLLTLTH